MPRKSSELCFGVFEFFDTGCILMKEFTIALSYAVGHRILWPREVFAINMLIFGLGRSREGARAACPET
ncbi:hypothetical protein [Chlamydia ibidis]|uniref:hypothetical protein n=1 Tax=Chlamydia ibidis TaxID=1405396 RepID=UPI0012DE5607|nr:hypothetical protein [Chlamydia ibidis]